MKLNILVVDDETPICDWLVYCIRKASQDYVADSAFNGQEALEKALRQKPDLVITDIRMPRMDGLELMRRIQEVLPLTTFVILTNYAEFRYAKEAVSLGAREYILKSEMRAADMEVLLAEILALKASKINEKSEDVFVSGCIDLYNFYCTQENAGAADRFWERQGMKKAVPYRVLCISGGSNPEEWREAAMWAEHLKAESEGQVYCVAASEKEFDYLVVQSETELNRWTERLSIQMIRRGRVGISTEFCDREEMAFALREASCAQVAGFFREDTGVMYMEELQARPLLHRETLQRQRGEILNRIGQKRFQEAAQYLEEWFGQIAWPAAEDVKWAVDYCRRIVLAIEEFYYQEVEKAAQEVKIHTCVEACRERCREMLDAMWRSYTRRYSSSIAAALEYIHDHYGSHISMAETAKQVYRSPEYFSRQFKEEVGENFNTYLTLYRLDRAQELLDRTDMRIVEIAEKVGYTTPGYFSRLYKKYKGITPEQARMSKNNEKCQKSPDKNQLH